MAEVLITLGIIGVVAALTMPSLISNYQKHVWAAQLKKDVNFMQNTVKLILSNEEVDSLFNTSVYVLRNEVLRVYSLEHSILNDKYMKLEINSKNSEFDKYVSAKWLADYGETPVSYKIKDGSCVAILPNMADGDTHPLIDVLVDVNCDKKPNKQGSDRFSFMLNYRGKLLLDSGHLCSDEEIETNMNKEMNRYIESGLLPEEDIKYFKADFLNSVEQFRGSACFARILRDGWQMKY